MDYEQRLKAVVASSDKTLQELLDELQSVDTNQLYDDFLDECYQQINICGYNYYPSNAFELVDPIAYRCSYSDWLDGEERNDNLISFDNGCNHYHVYQIEELLDQYEEA